MTYLLNEPIFCEQLARFIKPGIFKDDYITARGLGRQHKLSGVAESRIVFWTPPPNIDAYFRICNRYEKLFISDQTETGWREGDKNEVKMLYPDLTINIYAFAIVAREHLKVTQKRFEKTLSNYQGNCLLVRSIEVDNLTTDEIKIIAKKFRYDLVMWDVVLK